MIDHRWSGWPGAWCLDCGVIDLTEQGVTEGCQTCEERAGLDLFPCEKHTNAPCLEPNSHRHDPYHESREAIKPH